MKRAQFMIQDYPQLVKYFAARNPVHLLLFVLPLWSLALYLTFIQDFSLSSTMLAILFGVLYWSFLEYGIHRWLYHTAFQSRFLQYFLGSFHQYHHKDMSDHRVLNAGFLMVYLVTPVVLSPFLLVTQDLQIVSGLALGLISAHYFYEWVHFTLHLDKFDSGYLNYIQKYHFHHHDKAPLKNFGNTSHFWDVVFGTYDGNYKDYEMPEKSQRTLINYAQK
jgi:sterol desaturase/sphingolipid hydroxylase (fatty acid hydroxylase superfamily)